MKKGFTLVEIMVVVAIIALLIAYAIPNYLRAKITSNESAAIGSLRTLSTAMEAWRASNAVYTGAGLGALNAPPDGGPAFIDATFAAGQKQGYNFALNVASPNTYTCTAVPIDANTGIRSFSVGQSGVIMDTTNGVPIE